MLLTTSRSACVAARSARASGSARPVARPFTGSRVAPQVRDVRMNLFNFGKNNQANKNDYKQASGRDEYIYEDVDDYFNYMGFLAEEGCYDRMEAMLKVLHPIDCILLLAASQNDTPKIKEILEAGANPNIKGLDGKTPAELATKAETIAIIKEAAGKVKV